MRSKMYLLCEKSVWCVGWFNSKTKIKRKKCSFCYRLQNGVLFFFSHDDRQFCLELSFFFGYYSVYSVRFALLVYICILRLIRCFESLFKCFLECLENNLFCFCYRKRHGSFDFECMYVCVCVWLFLSTNNFYKQKENSTTKRDFIISKFSIINKRRIQWVRVQFVMK